MKKVLSVSQYVVFYLKFYNNLKYSVIADIMGLTKTAVRQHYCRALKKIQNIE